MELTVWYFQHIFGHHPYTNIDGFDPDVSTAHHVSSCAINRISNTCIWTGSDLQSFSDLRYLSCFSSEARYKTYQVESKMVASVFSSACLYASVILHGTYWLVSIGGLPSENVWDARRQIWIKPVKEMNYSGCG